MKEEEENEEPLCRLKQSHSHAVVAIRGHGGRSTMLPDPLLVLLLLLLLLLLSPRFGADKDWLLSGGDRGIGSIHRRPMT